MSFANFGLGLAGFAQGLNSGIDAGTKIGGLINQGKIRQATKQGLEDAKAARQADIDKQVQVGAAPSADNSMTVPAYQVGDQTYADQGGAQKAAAKNVGDLDEYFQKVAAPKIYEEYLQVDPEKAQVWKDWSENQQVKAGMKHWAQAARSAAMGDFDGFGKNMVKAYNAQGYYDDGVTAKSFATKKDKDGNVIGATLTFAGPDGKEFSQDFDGSDDVIRAGLNMLSPQQTFEAGYKEQLAVKQAQIAANQAQAKFSNQVALEDHKAANQQAMQDRKDASALDRLKTGKELDALNQREKIALQTAAQQAYKRATSPQEAKRMLITSMQGKFVDSFGQPTKTPEEMNTLADQLLEQIYPQGGQRAPAARPGNPLSGGLMPSAQAGVPPTSNGLLIWDNQKGGLAQ